MFNRSVLSGSIMFLSLLLGVFSVLSGVIPLWVAGGLSWIALFLLIFSLKKQQQLQALIMISVGGAGLLWGWSQQVEPEQLLEALYANQSLVGMLIAVSFLRLITSMQADQCNSLPKGVRPLGQTLLGLHLFGSVINNSAVVIVGERIAQQHKLKRLQALVLSRGFALAALWSPFFASMGVALTNAPGAELKVLSLAGLPIAICALILVYLDIAKDREVGENEGYPLHMSSLWVPVLLAVVILIGHELFPDISVLTLISTASLVMTSLVLLLLPNRSLLKDYQGHIVNGLPKMGAELLLFLSAGVLAVGISMVVATTDIVPEFKGFGVIGAVILLLITWLVSVLGVHPVITVATAGGILAPVVDSPNLLGLTFLMCWSIGLVSSPFSGLHLLISGRYQINNLSFFRWNSIFTCKLLLLLIVFLVVYEKLGVFG